MKADPEPREYLAQHLKDAFAADARTGELGLAVDVVGERLIVRGIVGSEERRRAINDIAQEVVPDVDVVNETDVKDLHEPGSEESIR